MAAAKTENRNKPCSHSFPALHRHPGRRMSATQNTPVTNKPHKSYLYLDCFLPLHSCRAPWGHLSFRVLASTLPQRSQSHQPVPTSTMNLQEILFLKNNVHERLKKNIWEEKQHHGARGDSVTFVTETYTRGNLCVCTCVCLIFN